METLKFFRNQFGYYGLITYGKNGGDTQGWGFDVRQTIKNGMNMNLLVRADGFETYEEAEQACIEFISKELNKSEQLIK